MEQEIIRHSIVRILLGQIPVPVKVVSMEGEQEKQEDTAMHSSERQKRITTQST